MAGKYEAALRSAADYACDKCAEFAGQRLRSLRGGRQAFYANVDMDACKFGVGVVEEYEYLVYQDTGFETFVMSSLRGKAQPLSELVLTPGGFVPMSEIIPGSFVIGSDGNPTEVIAIFDQGESDVYEVEFYDGAHVRCTKEHLWSVKRKSQWVHEQVLPLSAFMGELEYLHASWRVRVGPKVNFNSKDKLILDPYFVGAMIGDGCMRGFYPSFSCYDEAGIKPFVESLPNYVRWHRESHNAGKICLTCYAPGQNATWDADSEYFKNKTSPLIDALKEIGLWGKDAYHKFIPEAYMLASIEDRVSLLQGLMDTDGSCNPRKTGICLYATVSGRLAEQVRSLVLSLGGLAYIHKDVRLHKYRQGECFVVEFRFDNDVIPFRADYEKKKNRYLSSKPTKLCFARRFKAVKYLGREECRCIQVANDDGLYITNDYILTHNCVPMMLNGQLIFRKATGINQWRSGKKVYWRRGADGELLPSEEQRRAWVHPGLPPKDFIHDGIMVAATERAQDIYEALVEDLAID